MVALFILLYESNVRRHGTASLSLRCLYRVWQIGNSSPNMSWSLIKMT